MADPRDYVHGDSDSIQFAIDDLNAKCQNYNTLYDAIEHASSQREWSGVAANAARETLKGLPGPWKAAADAHSAAADALTEYKAVLVAAQADAQRYIDKWNHGNKITADWDGQTPAADPGHSIRQAATDILVAAQTSVVTAGKIARDKVREAADVAPDGPGLFEVLGQFFVDILQVGAYSGIPVGLATAGVGAAMMMNPVSAPVGFVSVLGGLGLSASALAFLLNGKESGVDATEHLFNQSQQNMIFNWFRPEPGIDQDLDDVLWQADLDGTSDFHDQAARGVVQQANQALTDQAIAYGSLIGDEPTFDERSGLYIIDVSPETEIQMRSMGSGGLTVGNVYFSFDREKDLQDPALLMHEWKHARQWAQTGPASFLAGYFSTLGLNKLLDTKAIGPFEQAANARDGNYAERKAVTKDNQGTSLGDPFALLSELRKR